MDDVARVRLIATRTFNFDDPMSHFSFKLSLELISQLVRHLVSFCIRVTVEIMN